MFLFINIRSEQHNWVRSNRKRNRVSIVLIFFAVALSRLFERKGGHIIYVNLRVLCKFLLVIRDDDDDDDVAVFRCDKRR